MHAELDTVNGKPVLRISRQGRGKRATFDLELTEEQRRKIVIHTDLVDLGAW